MGINVPQNLATLLLSIHPKDVSSYHKDTCSIMLIVALFIISKNQKQSGCSSIEEWIKKMWYTYTMEYYPVIKKDATIKFASKWMELEKYHPE